MLALDVDGLELVKDRPLGPGHRLYLLRERSRRRDAGAVVVCSCDGERLVYGSASHPQTALDMAARSHGSEIRFGDFRLGRLLADLRAELELETDVADLVDRYGARPLDVWIRAELSAELERRLWTEVPVSRPSRRVSEPETGIRTRRTPRR